MTKSSFKHVAIKGISTVVPEKEINIYDEAEYYDNNIKKIDRMRKMVGFHKRRVADENTTASDLAICAARNLLADMNIDKSTIDALVFVTQQPDYTAPATAYFIHQKLGLSDNTPAFDVNNGCAGFVYGMWVVSQMIESGTCKRVLLVCGDTPSVGINLKDRNSAPIFGDGGVATLVEYSEEETKSYYNIEVRSNGFEAIISPMTGARFRGGAILRDDTNYMLKLLNNKFLTSTGNEITIFDSYLNGMAVFDFTISVVPQNIKDLLEFSGKKEADIDMLCLHQANKQIVLSIGNAVDFPEEKVPYYAFENYGNNTMCSVPTTISSVLEEQTKNGKVTICGSGFGNGLTCASFILDLNKIYNSGIQTYIEPEYTQTREEYVEYWLNKMKGQ